MSAGYVAWEVGCLHVGVSPPVPPQPSLHPLYPTLSACNVTIHNRCKDTLANCTKVKQKVRRQGGQRAFGEGSAMVAGLSTHSLPYAPLLAMGHPRPLAYVNIVLQHEFTLPDALTAGSAFSQEGSCQILTCPWSLGDGCLSLALCLTATESCAAEEQHRLAVRLSPK